MLKSVLAACVAAGVWNLSCVADEQETEVRKAPRYEFRVEKKVTTDEDGEPQEKVAGRIVIVGPDGKVEEYSLDDKLPEGVRVLISKDDEDAEDEIAFVAEGEADIEEERLMIGVHCDLADDVLRSHLKLGDAGLIVLEVIDDSPAQEAGLQKSDILVQADGSELTQVEQLVDAVRESEGEALELVVVRSGDRLEVTATPRRMKTKQRIVLDQIGDMTLELDGEQPHVQWLERLENLKLPEEALDAIRKGQAGVRLRSIQPGIVIDRDSRPEDIEKIVAEARRRAEEEVKQALEHREQAEAARRQVIRQRARIQQQRPQNIEQVRAEVKRLEAEIARLQEVLKSLSEPDTDESQDEGSESEDDEPQGDE